MATLRNKTTDSGVIIRWKPHPDHNRPSTYQVTPSAVSFLEEIGFSVPSPGDEVEIPWDVCRPLRVLGDLYFKSETPGEVDTGDIGDVDESYGRSLTDEQQARLRNYIETHSQYGSASNSLKGELSSLPETEAGEDNNESEEEEKEHKPTDTPSKLDAKNIIVGRVDRLSSSGNAMLKTETGEQYNLGPLTEAAVGEKVPVKVLDGTWALCLAPQFWNSGYGKHLSQKAKGVSAPLIEDLFSASTDRQLQTDLDAFNADVDDIISVAITHSTDQIVLGNNQNQILKVITDHPIPTGELNVRVLGRQGPILVAEPVVRSVVAPEVGEPIEVVVSRTDSDGAYGLYEKTLVHIPGSVASTTARIRAGVTTIGDQKVTASVAALPESDRPTEGDTVWVEAGSLTDYSSILVTTPALLTEVSSPLQLAVTTVGTDHVAVGVTWDLLPDVSVGDDLEVEQVGWLDDGTLFVWNGVPVLVDGFHADYGKERRVKLTGQDEAGLRAEVIDEIQSVGDGTLSDYVEAMQKGHSRLDSGNYRSAAASFTTAIEHAPGETSPYWIDARSCRAYAIVTSLMQDERFDEAWHELSQAREDLESVVKDAPVTAEFCLAELDVLEHTIGVRKAWARTQSENDIVSSRKARAGAKRELRRAAETGLALLEEKNKDDLNRNTLHPVLIRAIHDVVETVDHVHDTVTQFLEITAFPETIQWTSLTEIEVETTREEPSLVEPFERPQDLPEGIYELRARAEEVATSAEDAIDFRDMSRSYRHSEAVQQYVRCRADGVCEACGDDAPFEDTQGQPYLELHHVDEFEMTGPDVPSRVVALCPTCHTRVHAGADGAEFNTELRAKLDAGLADLGSSSPYQDN